MGQFRAKPLLGQAALLVLTGGAPGERRLTFHERVEAQRAIERVYHSHQIGAKSSFEEAVPTDLLGRKVRAYLKKSAALERFWGTPITAGMLSEEWERIARESRMPERLGELYAALGHDTILIQECLVRPVLADRLVRERFESDERLRGEGGWDAWWAGVEGTLDPDTVEPVEAGSMIPATAVVPAGEGLTAGCTSGTWVDTAVSRRGPLAARYNHSVVWTGNEMIIWGGLPFTKTGAR